MRYLVTITLLLCVTGCVSNSELRIQHDAEFRYWWSNNCGRCDS